MSKLGVAYNLFDGIELLEKSIDSIRSIVDYVCVVYQIRSNFGNDSSVDIKTELDRLCSLGKIDTVHEYVPSKNGGHVNEIKKRNIGLELSSKAGCTHFMSCDVDEMYDTDELNYAYRIIVDGNYDSSACNMLTYYKSGEYIVDPPEEYFVSLIYKINGRAFDIGSRWPVLVDPTRRMDIGSCKIFTREEIQMHHFSYVRKDIRAKLANSSAVVNFAGRIEEIASHHDNWQFGQKCMFAGKEKRLYDVKRVENKFNVTCS